MQQLSGKEVGDKYRAAVEHEQMAKELENLALRRGVALDGSDLTQVRQAVEWGDETLVGEHVGSGAAELEVYGDLSSYDLIKVQMFGVSPVASPELRVRFVEDDGTVLTASAYDYSYVGHGSDDAANNAGDEDAAFGLLASDGIGAVTALKGNLTFVPSSFSLYGTLNWTGNSTATNVTIVSVEYGGLVNDAGGIRVYPVSGNISGTLRLWGLPKGS